MRALDHVVFNTRDQTDGIVALFEAMGFIVTPRGFHTLGSINHTIVFDTTYLELLGYPPEAPPAQRPELVQRPAGLMATVLQSADADATHRQLRQSGFAPRPVQSFSRPVDLDDGGRADAAFRVTRLEPEAVPGTWFYFCQHLTPALVWRPPWQQHASGNGAIVALDIEVADPLQAAPAYQLCLGLEPGNRCNEADGSVLLQSAGCAVRLHPGSGGMRGITIALPTLEPLRRRLETAAIPFCSRDGSVDLPRFGGTTSKLQFIAQAR